MGQTQTERTVQTDARVAWSIIDPPASIIDGRKPVRCFRGCPSHSKQKPQRPSQFLFLSWMERGVIVLSLSCRVSKGEFWENGRDIEKRMTSWQLHAKTKNNFEKGAGASGTKGIFTLGEYLLRSFRRIVKICMSQVMRATSTLGWRCTVIAWGKNETTHFSVSWLHNGGSISIETKGNQNEPKRLIRQRLKEYLLDHNSI